MALINCPECGHDVSDTAESCPNCGYSISHYLPRPRRTTLHTVKRYSYNFFLIILGVLFLLPSMFALIVFPFFGIFCAFLSVGMIMAGIQDKGTQTGPCPYCGHSVNVPAKSETFRCPHCGKISSHLGSYLERID